MLTEGFYSYLAYCLKVGPGDGALAMAIGRGAPAWDRSLPSYERGTGALVDEVARKKVGPRNIAYSALIVSVVSARGDDVTGNRCI